MSATFVNSPRIKPKAIIVSVAFVILAALAASARAWLITTPDAQPLASAEAQGQASGERLEAELLTIRPTGFDPVEITRPRGRFILVVNNRSGVHDLELRLDRERGERQIEVRLPRGRLGWKKLVDPPPGTYILTEANHPDWVCRINITPR